MAKPFLVSDESINCYGIRLLTSGGITTAFQKNPTMLFMHERGRVIGRWDNLRVEDNTWIADPVFDVGNTYAADIAGQVDRGFLVACSAGVNVIEGIWNDALGCYDATKWEFLEISIVDRGGNVNAVRLMAATGEMLTELQLSERLAEFKPTPTTVITNTQTMQIELSAIAMAMGLPETATKEEVLAKAAGSQTVSNATIELAALKDQIKATNTAKVLELVDAAVIDLKIAATAKGTFLTLFGDDVASATAIIAALPKPQNLVELAAKGLTSDNTAVEATTLYDQYDKADKLVNLKATNPTEFKRLYKAKFGNEPKD